MRKFSCDFLPCKPLSMDLDPYVKSSGCMTLSDLKINYCHNWFVSTCRNFESCAQLLVVEMIVMGRKESSFNRVPFWKSIHATMIVAILKQVGGCPEIQSCHKNKPPHWSINAEVSKTKKLKNQRNACCPVIYKQSYGD